MKEPSPEKKGRARTRHRAATRRDLLKGGLGVSAASLLGGCRSPAAHRERPGALQITNIESANIVDQYHARQLQRLSDAELYSSVASVVSQPAKEIKSFTIHAPLELLARYGLLPLVRPEDRELARIQMIASATLFESFERFEAPPTIQPFPDLATAEREFSSTLYGEDMDGLEAITLRIAEQYGLRALGEILAPVLLPTFTSASHSHIALWLLLRHGQASRAGDASLIRAGVRQLAGDPTGSMVSYSGMDIAGERPLHMTTEEIEREILDKLVDPPRGEISGAGLRGILESGERTGNADAFFTDFLRHDLSDEQIDAAYRAVLRVSAYSMLQDRPQAAKFGWSHALTMPQAACGLSTLNLDRKLSLAATLVWITAYRSVFSKQKLDFEWIPEPVEASFAEALNDSPQVAAARAWHARADELMDLRSVLASEASVRNDQHLAKYVRACLDMGSFDPEHAQLYLSSASYLCSLWMQEAPRSGLLDNLTDRFI